MATKNAQIRRNGPSKRSRRGTSRANGGAAVAFQFCWLGRFRRFILFTALRGGRTALRRRRSTRTSTRSRVAVVFSICPMNPERTRGYTSTATRRMRSLGAVILLMSSGIATPASSGSLHLSSRRRSASPPHPEFYFTLILHDSLRAPSTRH